MQGIVKKLSNGVEGYWGNETGGSRENGGKQPPSPGFDFPATPWEPGSAGFASADDLRVMSLSDSRFPPQGLRAGFGNARI